jgi:hypothetical protein
MAFFTDHHDHDDGLLAQITDDSSPFDAVIVPNEWSIPRSPSPPHQQQRHADPLVVRVDDHERRLCALEAVETRNTNTNANVTNNNSNAAASFTAALCPILGCGNSTGLGARSSPSDLRKHLALRAHVEAVLCLSPPTIFRQTSGHNLQMCSCDVNSAFVLDVGHQLSLRKRNNGISDFFRQVEADALHLCQNKACLGVKKTTPLLLRAVAVTQQHLRDKVYASAAKPHKRARSPQDDAQAEQEVDNANDNDDELSGDQTVAVAFGREKFSTPGAVYVLFDAANNQLRVQMKRPDIDGKPVSFHVAHVARMHRWMKHVLHFAPRRHKLWDTHVAVADSGFIDAFVLASASDVGDIDNGDDRERLYQRMAAGELVLCAGRSDGWLDLVPAADVALQPSRIALPLTHLQPHTFRRFDAQAQPSLPLMSERQAPLQQQFDVRMQHYAPCNVQTASNVVKLEMLCKCGGWFLVAPTGAVAAAAAAASDAASESAQIEVARQQGRETMNSLIEAADLEELSQQALEASLARRRAIDAIEQAEQLRLQNISLSQRLADAERVARERSARENAALTARVAELEQRLARRDKDDRDKRREKVDRDEGLYVAPPATPVALPPPPPAMPTKTHHTLASLLLDDAGIVDSASIEREMCKNDRRVALYYRRGDQKDLRLCVRLTTDEFVHSKITQNSDGTFACLRQVCASTLEELLNVELDL